MGLEGSQGKRLESRRGFRESGQFASSRVADVVASAAAAADAAEEAVAAVEGQGARATRQEPKAGERGRSGQREGDGDWLGASLV